MRYKPYEKYKPSGIEWLNQIPDDWHVSKMRFAGELNSSGVDKKIRADEDLVKSIHYVDVYRNQLSEIGESNNYLVVSVPVGKHYKCNLKLGDVLFTNSSETPDDIAKSVVIKQDLKDTLFGYHLMRFRPHPIFVTEYLKYLFGNKLTHSWFSFRANGITRFGITYLDFADAKIVIPPMPEQKAIANFLDSKTDIIKLQIEKIEHMIKLLKEKREALIVKAVTKGLNPSLPMQDSGIEWIGEVPQGWRKLKLSWLFRVIGSGTTPNTNDESFYDGDIPWINTGDLNDRDLISFSKTISKIALHEHSVLKVYPVNTLIVALYGATIGKLAITKFEATTNQACCAMCKPHNNTLTKFVFYWFLGMRKHIIMLAYGGSQPNISQNLIRSLRVWMPTMREQTAIADYLDDETIKFDLAVRKNEQMLIKLKEYQEALITAAVTGKIDVRSD